MKLLREVISAYAAGISGFPGKVVDHVCVPSASQLTGICPKEKRARRSEPNED